MSVTVRVYEDKRKVAKDCCDRFTIYFPIAKRNQKVTMGNQSWYEYGLMLYCDIDNKNGCVYGRHWDNHESYRYGRYVNSNNFYLGKRLKIAKLHPKVRKYIKAYEKMWNKAQYGTEKDIEKFNTFEPKQ